MPPKKSSLARKTKGARGMSTTRNEETEEQSQDRLQKNREFKSNLRQNQSESEKEDTLSKQRTRDNLKLKSLKKSDLKEQNKLLKKTKVFLFHPFISFTYF